MPFVRNISQAGQYPEALRASADTGGRAQQATIGFHLQKHPETPCTLDTWSEEYLPDKEMPVLQQIVQFMR